jgi:O-antigen/teichoic acid export membrane protein
MPFSVALILTMVAALDLAIHAGIARRVSPWARIRFGVFDWVLLRRLIGPSVGHATIYIAVNSVVVQGPRVVLSAMIGPAAVSIFSVFSTLARSIDHITALVTPVLQLEFARNASAEDGAVHSRRMVVYGSQFAIASYLILSVVIFLAGPFVIPAWTSYKITFDGKLLGVILVTSFFTQLGRSSQSYLMGHNLVQGASLVMLFLGVCGLVIGAALTLPFNVSGMAIGILISEALTTGILIALVAQYLKTPLLKFFSDQLDLTAGVQTAIRVSKTIKLRLRNSDSEF